MSYQTETLWNAVSKSQGSNQRPFIQPRPPEPPPHCALLCVLTTSASEGCSSSSSGRLLCSFMLNKSERISLCECETIYSGSDMTVGKIQILSSNANNQKPIK